MLRVGVAVMAVLMPVSALAVDYPKVKCLLSDDQSSVVVIASNPSDTSCKCTASCRANVTGQRALQRVECNFALSGNATEKTACTKKGGSPGFFSGISPTKFACAPKN
jgi:hypothetical protein